MFFLKRNTKNRPKTLKFPHAEKTLTRAEALVILVIRNRVRECRKQKEMTMAQLSQKAKVGLTTISNMERGIYVPRTDCALMIAQELGCTVEELFWMEGLKPEQKAKPVTGGSAMLERIMRLLEDVRQDEEKLRRIYWYIQIAMEEK